MKVKERIYGFVCMLIVSICIIGCKNTFAATKYTVTYDPGTGTGKPISMSDNSGRTQVAAGQPGGFKNGNYKFLGWSMNKNAVSASITTGSKFVLNKNITLYAVWSDNTSVVYDIKGGTSGPSGPVTVKIGISKISLDKPEKNGYVFAGWVLRSDKSKIYQPGDSIKCMNTTALDALWKCQVTYQDPYDSNLSVSYLTNSGSTEVVAGEPGSFKKTGYRFQGWSLNKNATKASINTGSKITINRNTILYAVFDNSVYLTYNSNGGSNGPSGSNKSTYGKSVTISKKEPTRTGYDFKGWIVQGGNGKIYQAGSEIKLYKNSTLKAQWKIKNYDIKYCPNGATGTVTVTEYQYGDTAKIKNKPASFKKTGYTFQGWSTSKNGSVKYEYKDEIKVKSNINLYAVWKANKYSVTINPNGGKLNGIKGKITEEYGETVTLDSKIPVYDDYVFKGYSSTGANGKVNYKNGSKIKISGNVTLYAIWERQHIEFDGNGYTCSQKNVNLVSKNTLIGLPKLSRTGYAFLGWSTSKTSKSGYTYMMFSANDYYGCDKQCNLLTNRLNIGKSKNIKLYAIWERNEFNVSFDTKGGTGSFAAIKSVKKNASITIPYGEPERNGYVFAGWTTNANDLSTLPNSVNAKERFNPGQQMNNITRDVKLYAVWVKNTQSTVGGTVFFYDSNNLQTENEQLRDDNEYPVSVDYVDKRAAYVLYERFMNKTLEGYEASESKLPFIAYLYIACGEEDLNNVINTYVEAEKYLNEKDSSEVLNELCTKTNSDLINNVEMFAEFGVDLLDANTLEEKGKVIAEFIVSSDFKEYVFGALKDEALDIAEDKLVEIMGSGLVAVSKETYEAFCKSCGYEKVEYNLNLLKMFASYDLNTGVKVINCVNGNGNQAVNYADWDGKTINYSEPTYICSKVLRDGQMFKAAMFTDKYSNVDESYLQVKLFNVYATRFVENHIVIQ